MVAVVPEFLPGCLPEPAPGSQSLPVLRLLSLLYQPAGTPITATLARIATTIAPMKSGLRLFPDSFPKARNAGANDLSVSEVPSTSTSARLTRQLIRLVNIIRRKCDTRRDVLIQPPQSFEHYLRPWLIDGAATGFHVHAKFKLSIRKRQRIVNGVDSMQHANTRVNHRACLQIKKSRTLRIQNFKTAALSSDYRKTRSVRKVKGR